MDEYMELIRETENMKYEDLSFSFNMPLRDFIQWVLNIQVGYIFLFISIIFLIYVLLKTRTKK